MSPGIAPSTPLSRALREVYELVFVLVFGWVLAFPLHQRSLDHRNLEHTFPDRRVRFDGEGLAVGDILPAYRLNPGWQVPIGHVRVDQLVGDDAIASGLELRWPLGRHGRILTVDGRDAVLDVGRELALHPGHKLGVYDRRHWLGDVEIVLAEDGRSTARVLFDADRDLGGLPVTEFNVMTQVVVRREPPWLTALEVLLGLGPALLWLAVRVRVGSPFAWLGRRVRPWLAERPAVPALAQALALGWGAGVLLPSVVCQLAWRAGEWLRWAELRTDEVWWWDDAEPWIPVTFGVALAGMLVLVRQRRPPLDAVQEWLRFDRSLVARIPDRWRAPVSWALHLLVVWAFASTLHRFVQANTWEMVELGWPGHPPAGGADGGVIAQLVWAVTHWPRVASAQAAFEIAKLAMWTATITGCMVGYGHSVIGPLVGKELRNVDFTPAGWITNALCYPLLGGAMWRLVADRPGADPAVVGGFVGGLLLFLGFLTNLTYTWSILNMGTKFGVMTDKGLVSSGWFSVVRHPNYALESMMFLTLEGAGLTTWHHWVGALGWAYLYWLRSEREDAFMSASNPDYEAYKVAVPWKFLPGIW